MVLVSSMGSSVVTSVVTTLVSEPMNGNRDRNTNNYFGDIKMSVSGRRRRQPVCERRKRTNRGRRRPTRKPSERTHYKHVDISSMICDLDQRLSNIQNVKKKNRKKKKILNTPANFFLYRIFLTLVTLLSHLKL